MGIEIQVPPGAEMQQPSLDKWMSKLKSEIKRLEKVKEKIEKNGIDRLEALAQILYCLQAIGASINGWNIWVHNPLLMKEFTEEEVKKVILDFTTVTNDLLKLDLEVTELYLSKVKKGQKEIKPDYVS